MYKNRNFDSINNIITILEEKKNNMLWLTKEKINKKY